MLSIVDLRDFAAINRALEELVRLQAAYSDGTARERIVSLSTGVAGSKPGKSRA